MNSLMQDAFAAVDATGAILIRNDSPLQPLVGTLTVTAQSTTTGLQVGGALATVPVALPRGAAAVAWACLGGGGGGGACADPAASLAAAGCAANGTDCVLVSTLVLQGGGTAVQNTQLWALPSALALARGAAVAAAVGQLDADGALPVTLTVQGGAAVLVVLTTQAAGRFSDNALVIVPEGQRELRFLPMLPGAPLDRELLAATLRVEHLAMYM
jgi:hypothetical protein